MTNEELAAYIRAELAFISRKLDAIEEMQRQTAIELGLLGVPRHRRSEDPAPPRDA